MSTWVIVTLSVLIAAGVVVVIAVVGGQAGRARGCEGMGGNTIVRSSRGHLFTTVWVVGASLKAERLGYKRYPVCEKWRIVMPVPDTELTDEDRRVAAEHHDSRLP
jgi:hypothetical protein